MKNILRRSIPLPLVLALLLVTSAVAVTIVSRTIQNTGIVTFVTNFNLYSDSGCTTLLTSYDWSGDIEFRGDVAVLDIWAKNTGEGEVVVKWNDDAPASLQLMMAYMDLSWQPWTVSTEAVTLAEGEVLALQFTVSIKNTAPEGSWSFDLVFDNA